MSTRNRATLFALFAFAAVAFPAAGQRAPAVPLFADPSHTTRTVSGSVSGYETRDYAFDAAKGDRVAIALKSANRHLYFNLMPPEGDAIYDGSIGGDRRFETTIAKPGRYIASVYFMRNDARRGAHAEFQLQVTRTPAGTDSMARGASFDCRRAASTSERMICSTPKLVALDGVLADLYRYALTFTHAQGGEDGLRSGQRDWLAERDHCLSGAGVRACMEDAYRDRIAFIQARYAMLQPNARAMFDCGADKPLITAVFFPTDPPSARLERGHENVIVLEGQTGSGARYVGEDGLVFWNKGSDASVEWPGAGSFQCTAR
jgi:uncharacterized protein